MADNTNNKRHIVICGKGGGGSSTVTWDDIQDKPEFATVATTGDYDDLTDKPTIPAAPVQSDWNEADNTSLAYIANKPSIPAAQVNSDWNAVSGVAEILNKPNLATVATSGSYNDLTDKPTILTQWFGTQAEYDLIDPKDPNTVYNIEGSDNVQPDWNQSDSSADDYIKNKPTIPAAPVQSNWNENDNTSLAYIQNKPTIPTVPTMATETLTFTLQGGTVKTVEFYTVPNYFYVEDISGSNNTLSIIKSNASAPTIEVFKSTDKTNWESMGTTSTTAITATIPANGKLYLKATTSTWGDSVSYTNTITASGNHNVGGNIMSLLYGDEFVNQTTLSAQYIFANLFMNNTKLINANNLELPATNITTYVYFQMFKGCTALTTAPELPATTLSWNCYNSMFFSCTSLTKAPVLKATTLLKDCYNCMFYGCSSLNRVTSYANDISALRCLNNWLYGVSVTGDFYNLGGATYESGVSGIPTGWTEHNSL